MGMDAQRSQALPANDVNRGKRRVRHTRSGRVPARLSLADFSHMRRHKCTMRRLCVGPAVRRKPICASRIPGQDGRGLPMSTRESMRRGLRELAKLAEAKRQEQEQSKAPRSSGEWVVDTAEDAPAPTAPPEMADEAVFGTAQ